MSAKKKRPKPSRRLFLKGSAAAAATPLVTGCASLPPVLGEDRPIRVGLIGCGGRGTGAALQAMRAKGTATELVAMGDAFADRLDGSYNSLKTALGEENAHQLAVDDAHRFVGLDAFEKVIDSDLDCVILTTPPGFRPAHLRRAVEAGRHVFSEKPAAVDAPGVRSVLESAQIARTKGLSLVCGFCWRFNARHRALWERVHAGQIGTVRTMYNNYNAGPIGTQARQDGWTDMEWQLRNWHHFNWLSGDHITEQAVHSLDKMAWSFDDVPPERATAVGGRIARSGAESGNIFDHFSVTYEYPDGAKAFHMSRQIPNCAFQNNDYIFGTRGTATIRGWDPLHLIEGEQPWEYEGPGNDMYQQEHDELFASIRDRQPINQGEWLAHSTLLAIMGRMAAYTGQVITWEQALNSEQRLGPDSLRWGQLEVAPVPVPGQTPFA
jgi:predicted dehydrogenase